VNEFEIQNALFRCLERKGYALCCPNYTPAGWWECDVFGVTKSGAAVEFEIKLTRADFAQDGAKDKQVFPRPFGTPPRIENKRELMRSGDKRAPARFFYVAPKGMIEPSELPDCCGLMEFNADGVIHFSVKKEAPKLHGERVSDAVMNHVRGVFYWRYWKIRANESCVNLESQMPNDS